MTAVIYLRRSSAPNAGTNVVSFEAQQAQCEALAARHGDTIDEVLTDWAKSGGSTKGRPGYARLLDGVRAGRIKAVYGYSLSRLTRSTIDFADLMEICRESGVTIHLVADGTIDHTTAMGRCYATIVAALAQMEREVASERINAAYAIRRARGDRLGQAPYGDKPGESLDAVIDAYRTTKGFAAAARLLNAQGVPTRRKGTEWSHTVVADIVRRVSPPDLAVVHRARDRASAVGAHRFSGLLRCHCGQVLTGRRFTTSTGSGTEYYCARASRTPDHGRTVIREATLLPRLQMEGDRLQPPPEVIDTVAADEAARTALEAKRERIIEAAIEGVLMKGERDERLAKVRADMDALGTREALLTVPKVDLGWDPADVNMALRGMWSEVRLDRDLHVIEVRWLDGLGDWIV